MAPSRVPSLGRAGTALAEGAPWGLFRAAPRASGHHGKRRHHRPRMWAERQAQEAAPPPAAASASAVAGPAALQQVPKVDAAALATGQFGADTRSSGPAANGNQAAANGAEADTGQPVEGEDAPLGTADLQCFMQQHGIAGAIVPPLNGVPLPPGCCDVKSLVFLVVSHPVVLVLPLAARVDERRLAALLHTGRNRVKLAPLGSLVQLCGYSVGNVPPFGHRQHLPVIVDSSVTAFASCYASGGSDEAEVLMSVPELLRASAATVADISLSGTATSSSTSSSSEGALEEAAAAEQASVVAAELPKPWVAGQVEVTLEGVVAQQRRIARLLLFANLVPLDAAGGGSSGMAEGGSSPGTATFLRRLWRHPRTQAACEVQLIMGKMLQSRLGSEAAIKLLRSVRTGHTVRVWGRVQRHLQKADSGDFRGPRDVCDVVVHEIQLIDAPPAPTPAQASGSSTSGATAPVRRPVPGAATGPCYQMPAAVAERAVLVDSEAGLQELEAALFGGKSAAEDAAGAGAVAASAVEAAAEPRGFDSNSAGSSRSASAITTSTSSPCITTNDDSCPSYRLVVGLDCEWPPYQRGEPHTPVSLLQLATPGAVFLLDMLAFCGNSSSLAGSLTSSLDTSNNSCDGGMSAQQHRQHVQRQQQHAEQPPAMPPDTPAEQQLPPLERRLSDLLARLFGDASIIKAGFGLGTDLDRLCESYPHLPCCGSQGPVPLRSHVDVLLLARTALGGSRLPAIRRCIGLSALSELVLGRPIDKSEQCSEWGRRPLSAGQLRYAATDAHALVALYYSLHRCRQGLNLPFWTAHFSGGLTDVATFHPSKRCSRRGAPGSDGRGGAARRSSSAGSVRLQRLHGGPGDTSSEGGKRMGQAYQLDVNVDYLLTSYLGRQLPQGGKAAVVRAAAALTGRSQSGRTPSFPRGCGGLLEWRNAFILFVSLPEAGRRLAYPNEFLWLPPAHAAALNGMPVDAAAAGGGVPVAAAPRDGNEAVFAAAGGSAEEERQWLLEGWRLALTWWPGKGQTLAHPAVQRLLAAGAAAAPAAASVVAAAGAKGDTNLGPSEPAGQGEGSSPPPAQQTSVLLFCRAGASPYIFCGRLRPTAVNDPPGSSAIGSRGAGSGCCISWELADSKALLASNTFRGLLHLPHLNP